MRYKFYQTGKWEIIAGIAILLFILACFVLPAGSDPSPQSYEETFEIHTIVVPAGTDIEIKEAR